MFNGHSVIPSEDILCTQVEDTDEHIKTTIKAGGLMDVVRSCNLLMLSAEERKASKWPVNRVVKQSECAIQKLGMHAAGGVLPMGAPLIIACSPDLHKCDG